MTMLMWITAQLPGVNRPLSVELRLINLCSCDFDSQEEHDLCTGRELLPKRSDFRSAEVLVQCSPFGGANSATRQNAVGSALKKENDGAENHQIKIHEVTAALPPNPAGCDALHYR